MAGNLITIDIDSQYVRLLQMRDNRVERWAAGYLPAGLVQDGAVMDVPGLADHLRRLMRSSGISGGHVAASVSGLFSVARLMRFHSESQSGILERVREAVPGEYLRLLWQTVRMDGPDQDFLVVGANEERVADLLRALRAAGLRPKVLELKSVALSRAVSARQGIVVNVEPSSVDVVLVVDGLPQVLRTVAIPGAPTVEERASLLAQTITHAVDYYVFQQERSLSPSDFPLMLVGPLADDAVLRQQIAQRVDYPLEEFQPNLEFPAHFPAAQYAVNIALALREAAAPNHHNGNEDQAGRTPIRINLVAQQGPLRRLSRRQVAYLAYLGVGLLLALLLYQVNGAASKRTADLKSTVDSVSKEISSRRVDLNKLTEVERAVQDFEQLTASRGRVAGARKVFEAMLTPGVTFVNMSVAGNEATFTAKAATIDDAIVFVEKLRSSGKFGDVPFSKPTTTDFTLKLALGAASAK